MPPNVSESYNNNTTINNNKDKETVIIFDWDDTLLSSSYLSSRGYRLDSDSSKLIDVDNGLRELEQSIISVLSSALNYSNNVYIITNAETGWVQLSAQKFIPAVLPILNRITILSARSTFESRYPESPLKWKFYAFQEKLQPLFNNNKKYKNILSFGDSHVEREAVRAVTRGAPNTNTKSVKFAERPSIEQLRRQIELVNNCFTYIHNHQGDLDLQLTVTINNNNTNNNQSNTNNSTQQSISGNNDNNTSDMLTDNSSNPQSCDQEAASEINNNSNIMQTQDEKPIEV
jgi:hypothetical protein